MNFIFQISKMYEKGYGHGGSSTDSEHRIQIEIQQLREDNRALRERNYKLHEESMQVREELMKLKEEGQRSLPPRDVRSSPRDTRPPRDIRTISPREVRTPLHSRGYSLGKTGCLQFADEVFIKYDFTILADLQSYPLSISKTSNVSMKYVKILSLIFYCVFLIPNIK